MAEEPDYAADESKPGFVRIKVKIELMKAKSAGLSSILTKNPHPKAKNADIVKPEFGPRSCTLQVNGHVDGTMKGKKFELKIRQLPHEIVPEDCYLTAEDGFVFIWLKKEDNTKFWESAIREGKLETAE